MSALLVAVVAAVLSPLVAGRVADNAVNRADKLSAVAQRLPEGSERDRVEQLVRDYLSVIHWNVEHQFFRQVWFFGAALAVAIPTGAFQDHSMEEYFWAILFSSATITALVANVKHVFLSVSRIAQRRMIEKTHNPEPANPDNKAIE